jgi:hypothetical protein
MRSPLGKELRKLYKAMMKAQFPNYKEDKTWTVPPGWYVWTYQHSCGLWFHILLNIHHSKDEFTNEVAWSYKGNRPEFEIIFNDEINMFVKRPMHIRISTFWSDEDHWWGFDPKYDDYRSLGKNIKPLPIEKSMELIVPAIYDSTEKLKKYVMPVFEEIVRRHGKLPCQDQDKNIK